MGGCNSTSKNENAVFGPSPLRTSLIDAPNAQAIAQEEAETEDEGRVTPVSATEDSEADLFSATVVARANGAPIFAGEVLERYGDYLRAVRPKVSDADFQKIREAIIQRDLKGHIQKHLLVERTKGELKPEQLKALQDQLDKMFEKKVEQLKKELKVSTRTELERELNNRGTSLNDVRNSFVTQGIAQGYLEARAKRPGPITRQDLVDYYHEHQDDYKVPAKVRWQQIQISHSGAGGRAKAEAKLREARAELDRGVPFAEVVLKYSDGPTAKDKGLRDWTSRGSLADEKLDQLLFSMPVGTAYEEYFGPQACQIVKVLERTEETVTPFAEVQEEIHEKLQRSSPQTVKELIDRIYADAIIETKYSYAGQDGGD